MGIKKDEIVDAVNRVADAFTVNHITNKEVYLALPVLIANIFEDLQVDKNIKAQQDFFEKLEGAVYEFLDEG